LVFAPSGSNWNGVFLEPRRAQRYFPIKLGYSYISPDSLHVNLSSDFHDNSKGSYSSFLGLDYFGHVIYIAQLRHKL
jgi:hypothetical protein